MIGDELIGNILVIITIIVVILTSRSYLII